MEMMRLAAIVLLVAGMAACSKAAADDGAAQTVLGAWEKAGLDPAKFEPVDGKPLGDGRCRAGIVKGIAATLCEYPDAAGAKRAETAGLSQVRNATGLSLAEGKLLLVLADRDHKDPNGKHMNEIAKAFRNR
jgi:hypothetical protein